MRIDKIQVEHDGEGTLNVIFYIAGMEQGIRKDFFPKDSHAFTYLYRIEMFIQGFSDLDAEAQMKA